MRVAVLLSGSGSNLQAMIDKQAQGALDVEICLAASNNPAAFGLERAKKAGIPTWAASHKDYPNREAFDADLCKAISQANAELIVLAGYMRLLSKSFLEKYKNKVINIHPSILPSFPGTSGAASAQEYGVKLTGCTVHFVEEEVDSGPVIIQAATPVLPGEELDALLNRIHKLEHRIYPQALQWLAEGRISLQGRSVSLAPGKSPRVYPQMQDDLTSQWLIYPPLEQGF